MSDIIKISELAALQSGSASGNDVLPMTNNEDTTTYKISLDSIDFYIKYSTGSRKFISGSSELATFATSSATSSYLNYTGGNTGTASYALKCLTSSYALTSSNNLSSSYAATASYIKNINYAEIETASFAKTASFLTYSPVRSNGTASFAISSSIAKSASYASGSNIFALSSSYSFSSSYSLSSSYSISSSYTLTSSHSQTSSLSNNSISASYIPNKFLNERITKKYRVVQPSGILGSGSIHYIMQYNNSNDISILKINSENNNTTNVLNISEAYGYTNAGMVSSSYSGKTSFIINSSKIYRGSYNNFTSQSVDVFVTNDDFEYTKIIVDIDDRSGISPDRSIYPIFYLLGSDPAYSTTALSAFISQPTNPSAPNKDNYILEYLDGLGSRINLHSTPKPNFPNSSSFYALEPVASTVEFFWFNTRNRRFYLMTRNNGAMHIFNINSYVPIHESIYGNQTAIFYHWWINTSRLSYFEYEKSILISDNGHSTANEQFERANIEIDPITGQELYFNICRHGTGRASGTAFKIPWIE